MTTEWHGSDFGLVFRESEILVDETTPFQKIRIVHTQAMGNVMFLDGLVMVTGRDEMYYHESLVHPAASTVPNLENALIIGGGDGGTVRELLKYNVQRVQQVEIDGRVVELSKQYFPDLACAYDDPRMTLHITDGATWVADAADSQFDLILIDSSEPIGPNGSLFTVEFYRNIRRILRPEGVLVLQAGSPMWQKEELDTLHRKLTSVFANLSPYLGLTPTYPGGHWIFFVSQPLVLPVRSLPNTRWITADAIAGMQLMGSIYQP